MEVKTMNVLFETDLPESQGLLTPDGQAKKQRASQKLPPRSAAKPAKQLMQVELAGPKPTPNLPEEVDWAKTLTQNLGLSEGALTADSSLRDLSPATRSRPVNWRWQVALNMEKGSSVPRHWGDQWVAKAIQFIRALRGCRDAIGILDLGDKMPELSDAFFHFADQAQIGRWLLEARLLSGEPVSVT